MRMDINHFTLARRIKVISDFNVKLIGMGP